MKSQAQRAQSLSDTEILSGRVRTVHVPQRENGWAVLTLEVGQEAICCAGLFPPKVARGLLLTCVGCWDEYDGRRQFRVMSAQAEIDRTREGITCWLQTIKGIGPKFSGRIFDHFAGQVEDVPDRVWSILRDDPERVLEVSGIQRLGPAIVRRIREQTVMGELVTWLMSFDISAAYCKRILDRYGAEAVSRVRENPYLLTEVRGIGFKKADVIGLRMGIAPNSPHRIRAGLVYGLEQAEGQGHCYLPEDELVRATCELLTTPEIQIEGEDVAAVADELVADGSTVRHARGIALPGLYAAEQQIANWIDAASALPTHALIPAHMVAGYEERTGFTLHPDQRQSIETAGRAQVAVITGGPGTGKTTILHALLEALSGQRLDIVLCAPTGRAAKRMTETSGRQALTVHRLLQYREGQRKEDLPPLGADVVVCDEASMVDVRLLAALVGRLRPDCRLILVGDVDQLPSVGAGRMLADLIESERVPVCRLTQIQRQAASSMIVVGAHALNAGEFPRMRDPEIIRAGAGHLGFVRVDEAQDIPGELELGIGFLEGLGYTPDDIAVMAPMRNGPAGVQAINEHLQDVMNPSGQRVENGRGIRLGDRVMHVRNNYRLDTFNGDVGRVVAIPPTPDDDSDAPTVRCVVDYDGRRVNYTDNELDELVLSYCSTIHKMQGSEARACLIVCHPAHSRMLTRRLVYTAMTRGRETVILVGTAKGVGRACYNTDDGGRYTMLESLLRDPDQHGVEDG